jgi:hypothetical protein
LVYLTTSCFGSKEFFPFPPLPPHIYFLSTSRENPSYLIINIFLFSVTGLNLNRLTKRDFTPIIASIVDHHVLARGSQEKVVGNIT